MTAKMIAIQALGFAGTVLFFLSYQCRESKNLFRVQFLSYLFYTVHLLLLGALTGGVSYLVNTLRSFCLSSSNKFARSRKMCFLICVLQAVTLFVTWSGWTSVLPVAANIAATLAGYSYSLQKIRQTGMFINSPLWILYDVIVHSWAGILDEVITEISIIISIARFGWKDQDAYEDSGQ